MQMANISWEGDFNFLILFGTPPMTQRHVHRHALCDGLDDAVMAAVGHEPTCCLIPSVSCF